MTGQMILPSNVRVLYESRIVSSSVKQAGYLETAEARSIRARARLELVHAVRRWSSAAPRLASPEEAVVTAQVDSRPE